MEHNEFVQHWNYFCSLASKLEETKDYIYHGIKEDKTNEFDLIHSGVYSDVFKQIILLAASEFEIMSKHLCNTVQKVSSKANIVKISDVILKYYPRIIETEVITLFWVDKPLFNWSIDRTKSKDNETESKVNGLEWWFAYNNIKHNNEDSYKEATLKNAVLSLAALYIVDLYCMYLQFNDLYILHEYPPKYFTCKYAPQDVFAAFGELPDFGNKSAVEKYHEMFEDISPSKSNEV